MILELVPFWFIHVHLKELSQLFLVTTDDLYLLSPPIWIIKDVLTATYTLILLSDLYIILLILLFMGINGYFYLTFYLFLFDFVHSNLEVTEKVHTGVGRVLLFFHKELRIRYIQ